MYKVAFFISVTNPIENNFIIQYKPFGLIIFLLYLKYGSLIVL